jgi:hypothetical protein
MIMGTVELALILIDTSLNNDYFIIVLRSVCYLILTIIRENEQLKSKFLTATLLLLTVFYLRAVINQ